MEFAFLHSAGTLDLLANMHSVVQDARPYSKLPAATSQI